MILYNISWNIKHQFTTNILVPNNFHLTFMYFQAQDHQLVEYDPDVDVDGLEETQPYLIEYLEEEIPLPKSPVRDMLKTPPKEIKREAEKSVKKDVLTSMKNQTFVRSLPILKNQVVRQHMTGKNTPATKHQSAAKNTSTVKNNHQQSVTKNTPVTKKEVQIPKPIIKKEVEKSAKKPTEKPQSEARKNPPRDINKRRYTTSELNDYLDSESMLDEEEEEFKIKKRRLTFSQQQKSLVDSLGMDEEEEDADIQVPTSTSTQKSNVKPKRSPFDDDDGMTTHQQPLPTHPKPLLPLAEAQSEYFRDKNIREEKKEQREAEEHKLKMKKLWLDIRKTLLEINTLESDNIDCEQ